MDKSVFETLNDINVGKNIEKKGQLSYLSWAWAWQEVKKAYPETTYKIYENANGMNYHNDNMTAWVKVGVTINELENIEYLPVMDFKNKSVALSNITSMDVNKAIQRALTKAIARHGLGLYIYAGEDLPEADKPQPIKLITDDDHKQLRVKLQEKNLDYMTVCTNWNLKSLGELQQDTLPSFNEWLDQEANAVNQ